MAKKPKAKMVWPQLRWDLVGNNGRIWGWMARTRKGLLNHYELILDSEKAVRVEIRPAKGAKKRAES